MIISTQTPVHTQRRLAVLGAHAAQPFATCLSVDFRRLVKAKRPESVRGSLQAKPSLKTSVSATCMLTGYIPPPVSPASGGYRLFFLVGRGILQFCFPCRRSILQFPTKAGDVASFPRWRGIKGVDNPKLNIQRIYKNAG